MARRHVKRRHEYCRSEEKRKRSYSRCEPMKREERESLQIMERGQAKRREDTRQKAASRDVTCVPRDKRVEIVSEQMVRPIEHQVSELEANTKGEEQMTREREENVVAEREVPGTGDQGTAKPNVKTNTWKTAGTV